MTRSFVATTVASLLIFSVGGIASSRAEADSDNSREHVLVHASSKADLDAVCDRLGAKVSHKCDGTEWHAVKVPKGSSVAQFLKDLANESAVTDACADDDVPLLEGSGVSLPTFDESDPAAVKSQASVGMVGALTA